jgi:hypothetical protein
MVNVMVANSIPIASPENPAKRKIHGKKALFIALPVLLVIVIGSLLYINIFRAPCNNLVKQSNADVSQINSAKSLNSTYNNLASHTSSCKSKSFLGMGGSSSSPSQLDQFQFYYNKATTGYDLGKTEEAKQDANSALAIGSKLSTADKKKLGNYDQLVKKLGYVKDGTY